MLHQLSISSLYHLTITIVPRRVKISADVCRKNVLQSHIATQKGRRSIRITDAARPKSDLLRLPQEVRAIILEHLFTMMTEGKTVDFKSPFGWPGLVPVEHRETVLWTQGNRIELPIFFVCKQLSEEAQEVFWTTNTFFCKLWDELGSSLMHVCFAEQKFLPRRRPKTIPKQFPLRRIRHLNIGMMTSYGHRVHILQGLWELAKLAHPKLQVKFSYYDVYSARDTNPRHTIDSELENWHKIKAYQILRKEAGLSMDFTFKEFCDMIHDTHWFSFDLPAITDKNVLQQPASQ